MTVVNGMLQAVHDMNGICFPPANTSAPFTDLGLGCTKNVHFAIPIMYGWPYTHFSYVSAQLATCTCLLFVFVRHELFRRSRDRQAAETAEARLQAIVTD